jgi:hypothetical protein
MQSSIRFGTGHVYTLVQSRLRYVLWQYLDPKNRLCVYCVYVPFYSFHDWRKAL